MAIEEQHNGELASALPTKSLEHRRAAAIAIAITGPKFEGPDSPTLGSTAAFDSNGNGDMTDSDGSKGKQAKHHLGDGGGDGDSGDVSGCGRLTMNDSFGPAATVVQGARSADDVS